MPKASKKRKEKAADFSKAKLKLGKGKQAASNMIDTSFKARSIALPSQSIGADKPVGDPTTKRKLTFDDLLTHLKHYNPATRREAILGLKELLDAHFSLVESKLQPLLNALVRLIADEDASVRKALILFCGWLLPLVPPEDLQPHSALLLLFTTSAQTHIFPEIRIDAVRLLDLYLAILPEIVVAGWEAQGTQRHGHGGRVLEGYLGILNAGTRFGEPGDTGSVKATSTASVVLSAASKLVILQSLARFLEAALSSSPGAPSSSSGVSAAEGIPTWYLASSFASREAYESFERIFNPNSTASSRGTNRTWVADMDEDTTDENVVDGFSLARESIWSQWTLEELSNTADLEISSGNALAAHAAHIARTLYSTLVATFLDNAPTVFSPSDTPTEVGLQTIIAITNIARSLYGVVLQSSTGIEEKQRDAAREELKGLVGYMTPYFPFVLHGLKRDIKIEQAFQDLNLIFCELTALLVLSSSTPTSAQPVMLNPHTQQQRTNQAPARAPPVQLPAVTAHVISLLRGEPPLGASASSLARGLSAQAYTALLPTIWALINTEPPKRRPQQPNDDDEPTSTSVLVAVLEHALRTSSASQAKRATLEFVGRLVLLGTDPQYRGALRLADARAHDWVAHLPKALWELGGAHARTSAGVLRLLLRLAQRRPRAAYIQALRGRLAPFFTVSHATRGVLPGPYAKLADAQLRRVALDVAGTLLATAEADAAENADGLKSAVDAAVMTTPEASYWAGLTQASLCT